MVTAFNTSIESANDFINKCLLNNCNASGAVPSPRNMMHHSRSSYPSLNMIFIMSESFRVLNSSFLASLLPVQGQQAYTAGKFQNGPSQALCHPLATNPSSPNGVL
jgi:hypothetical protein